MDLATILGIIIGFVVVLAAIFLGGSAGVFVNIPSFLIVVGGAIGGTMVRFPLKDVAGTLKLGAGMAFNQEKVTANAVMAEIVNLSQLARKGGALALESAEIDYHFLKKGITMFVDGQPEAFVRQALK
ncbi:MAG: flagellar motor protein PomA, partial [Pseudomonadota bacterium]